MGGRAYISLSLRNSSLSAHGWSPPGQVGVPAHAKADGFPSHAVEAALHEIWVHSVGPFLNCFIHLIEIGKVDYWKENKICVHIKSFDLFFRTPPCNHNAVGGTAATPGLVHIKYFTMHFFVCFRWFYIFECSGQCDIQVSNFGSGQTVIRYLRKN